MRQKTMIACMLLVVTALAGCTAGVVDDTHPFAGEWTTQGGLLMLFMETSGGGCETTWDANAGIAVNTIDCTALSDVRQELCVHRRPRHKITEEAGSSSGQISGPVGTNHCQVSRVTVFCTKKAVSKFKLKSAKCLLSTNDTFKVLLIMI